MDVPLFKSNAGTRPKRVTAVRFGIAVAFMIYTTRKMSEDASFYGVDLSGEEKKKTIRANLHQPTCSHSDIPTTRNCEKTSARSRYHRKTQSAVDFCHLSLNQKFLKNFSPQKFPFMHLKHVIFPVYNSTKKITNVKCRCQGNLFQKKIKLVSIDSKKSYSARSNFNNIGGFRRQRRFFTVPYCTSKNNCYSKLLYLYTPIHFL